MLPSTSLISPNFFIYRFQFGIDFFLDEKISGGYYYFATFQFFTFKNVYD